MTTMALLRSVPPAILLSAWAAGLCAQTMPTSQPALLHIIVEDVKFEEWDEHTATESGYPVALERGSSRFPYFALAAMTGTPKVWFVTPLESHAKMGEFMDEGDAAFAAEMTRLRNADAKHLSDYRILHAAARKDLSHGAFPDSSRQRFYEITTFRVQPGGEAAFEAAARAYGSAAGRAAPDVSYRVYEVIAGMPSPTYLVLVSAPSFADFDKVMAGGAAAMKAMTPQEQEAFGKAGERIIQSETQRLRLHPGMSYVPRSVRESDPAFWMPKD
jgi:hypothetical protein